MRLRILLAAVCATAALAAMSTIVLAQKAEPQTISATLKNVNGVAVGKVTFTAASAKAPVEVRVSVRRLQAGFHGFHIHAVGTCEGPAFMSATGHLKAMGQSHSDHIGDMSSLLAKQNGTASLRLTTDRFTLADLRDSDGSAVMVHANDDNFANIPSRYAPDGPDQATLDTGDSGARVACGEIAPD
jgi:Cu-Zn family superoxide dismutase